MSEAMSAIETMTHDEVRTRFPNTTHLTKVQILRVGPQQTLGFPQYTFLLLPQIRNSGGPNHGYWTDQETLVKFARHVLRHLDPTPQDRILESLERIEGLLGKSTSVEKS